MNTTILRATARLLTPVIVVYSLYLLWRGHDAPGGGFIAALVAGAAIALQYLSGGLTSVRRVLPARPLVLLGAGVLLATGYGIVGMLVGPAFLSSAVWRAIVPGLGELKLVSSLVFDVGVYLVVLAVVSSIVRYLGEEREGEAP